MRDYYVSPAGDDTAPGTRGRPLASFEPLSAPESPLDPGDTVHVRGGTIRSCGVVLRNVRGRPGAPISIVADGDAIPVIDCSAGEDAGFELRRCDGVAIRGLAVRGAASDGIRVVGSKTGSVTIAEVDVRDYARSGEGDGIRVTGAPDLSVRRCYLREGHRSAGTESRGIGLEAFSGRCRVGGSEFYRNPGGGAVVTNAGGPGHVLFRRCIAHRNGFDARGNRVDGAPGFRVDGGVALDRCIAYNNAGPGFEAAGTANAIVHGTAWANAGVGYRVGGADLANCLATANWGGAVERAGGRLGREEPWFDGGIRENGGTERGEGGGRECAGDGVVGTDVPGFRSRDDTVAAFLRPRDDSPVVDGGVDLRRPHAGSAPDVGARRAAADPTAGDDRTRGWLAARSGVLGRWRRSE